MIGHRLFWPTALLVALASSNLFFSGLGFFSVEVRDGHLYGSVIDILRLASPLILVSLGMTLVIATRGIDLSVGSVAAISGALACLYISRLTDQNQVAGVLLAVALAVGLSLLLGTANGLLVAGFGIQPIVATLILMVAGRGLAQLITEGQIITVRSEPFTLIGGGYWLTVPVSIVIALGVVALVALLVRRSALGLLIEAVGGNAEASRLAGVQSRRIVWSVYVLSGVCAGIAGLMIASNTSGADGNNAGQFIELDAILAVVIGGTLLSGGRFSIAGTVLGALLIQTLTTTIYSSGVPIRASLLVKALVVTTVCLVQSPAFRSKVRHRRRRSTPVRTVAERADAEVPA